MSELAAEIAKVLIGVWFGYIIIRYVICDYIVERVVDRLQERRDEWNRSSS